MVHDYYHATTRVGNGPNGFFLAMAHWQLGDKSKAREWFDKAAAWMEKGKQDDANLKRFRAEAAELLGVGKPSPTPKDKN